MLQTTVKYLEQHLDNQKLFVDLVLQVQKDFQTSVDTSIVFTAQNATELVVQVENELRKILASTSVSKFSNLLYRIDVAEKDVEAIISKDIDEYLQKIVFLILKREFQKVFIRNTF